MARRRYGRKKRGPTGAYWILLVLVMVAVSTWWTFLRGPGSAVDRIATGDAGEQVPKAPLTSDRPEILPDRTATQNVTEKGETEPEPEPKAQPTEEELKRCRQLIAAGKDALTRDDRIAARAQFSEALKYAPPGTDQTFLRAELTRLSEETLFSGRLFENDPLVARYVIQPGDSLGEIAKKYKISDDLIATINGIRNKNVIRAGQAIKVIHGPFSAVVSKGDYTLDVYLGDTFVKRYKVGLGEDDSTPTGEWQVSTKLKNPTYYPPRGGSVVAADDPENPLGERWIGLTGVSGYAVGAERYGVHGTVEPESIGKSRSLGCIRLYNEDVEELYEYLVPRFSTVKVVK